MTQTDEGRLLTDLMAAIVRLGGDLQSAGDRLTEKYGLTASRWQVLAAIKNQPDTVAAIARQMGLARQSVLRNVDLLSAQGLVILKPNPEHKRAALVSLSPEGKKLFTRLKAVDERWIKSLARGLSARELKAALKALARLEENLAEE